MLLLLTISRDSPLLEYFLRYYHSRGVSRFVCGVHRGKGNPDFGRVSERLRQYPCSMCYSYSEEVTGERDTEAHNAMRVRFVPAGEWYLVADADEFHHHRSFATFGQMRSIAEDEGADYVRSRFVDRLPADGRIKGLDLGRSLDDQFPYASSLTRNVLKGHNAKVVMARGDVPVQAGHHFAIGRRAAFECETHHFKWHDPDLCRRLLARGLAHKREGLDYWQEPIRFVEYFQKSGDCFDFGDPLLATTLAARIGI